MILIAPSILSADFTRIAEAVKTVEAAGADWIHIDIMDGHFVPNLTFGPQLVASLKKKATLPLDVHLMVDNPQEVIPWFLDAGADWVSIHAEASTNLDRDILTIRDAGRKAGAVLNPTTPLDVLDAILDSLDYVLLMSVNPGRGSQKFIESTHQKIQNLSRRIEERQLRTLIEIDGGVNLENMEILVKDGAQVFVAGNAIFNHPHPQEVVTRMKDIAQRAKNR
jgi:ribulose-phosphate 3-epimerase